MKSNIHVQSVLGIFFTFENKKLQIHMYAF